MHGSCKLDCVLSTAILLGYHLIVCCTLCTLEIWVWAISGLVVRDELVEGSKRLALHRENQGQDGASTVAADHQAHACLTVLVNTIKVLGVGLCPRIPVHKVMVMAHCGCYMHT